MSRVRGCSDVHDRLSLICFLPLFFLCYYLLPARFRNAFLLAGSHGFCLLAILPGLLAVDVAGIPDRLLRFGARELLFQDGLPLESARRVLILKDSMEDPMTDYWAELFSEIIVIDPRSYLREESLPELVAEYDIDMALFLYHQNNLSEELIDFLNRGE